jgi:sphingomyelin phosphodiesterase
MCMLIFRFENTVTAIFNGHTHNDHFHVYYATEEPTRPVSVAVNGGSVTPFSDLNSNYKIYTVYSATYVSISDVMRTKIFNAVLFIENF